MSGYVVPHPCANKNYSHDTIRNSKQIKIGTFFRFLFMCYFYFPFYIGTPSNLKWGEEGTVKRDW
jgi:hypothetical protein